MSGMKKSSGRDETGGLEPAAVQHLLDTHFPEARADIGQIDIIVSNGGDLASDAAAVLRLPYEARFARPEGTISGPTMFKLADLACYVAILGRLGETAIDAVTVTMTINFLARPVPGDLMCSVSILRQGRRRVVCEARIHGEDGRRLLAQASCIYALPPSFAA